MIQTLAPLFCANEECPEVVRMRRPQMIAEGEPGTVVRAWCAKCKKYTAGRV